MKTFYLKAGNKTVVQVSDAVEIGEDEFQAIRAERRENPPPDGEGYFDVVVGNSHVGIAEGKATAIKEAW